MEKKMKKAITYFIRKLLSSYFSRMVSLDNDDLNTWFFWLYSNSIVQKVCGYAEIMAIPSLYMGDFLTLNFLILDQKIIKRVIEYQFHVYSDGFWHENFHSIVMNLMNWGPKLFEMQP
jgi:hypothetical protein